MILFKNKPSWRESVGVFDEVKDKEMALSHAASILLRHIANTLPLHRLHNSCCTLEAVNQYIHL